MGVVLFSLLSRIVAIFVLIAGAAEFLLGLSIAMGWVGPYEQALARYSTASSSGELIDLGTHLIAFALVLGTLAEIGAALRKAARAA